MDFSERIKNLYGDEIAGRDQLSIMKYWSWYRGYVETFHEHRTYNGENFIYLTKKSMGMAKKVCETWADLLINEKCDITITDHAKKQLDILLSKTKFWTKANQMVEDAFALSYAAIVGEINAKREMHFVLIDALNIVPLKVVNEEIVDCGFYTEFEQGMRATLWIKNDIGYNVLTVDFDNKGQEICRDEFQTKFDIPLFMVIKPNIVTNLINKKYNYGISCFANSIDNLKAIDTKYDGFDFEFIGGRKKVYVSVEAMRVTNNADGRSQVINKGFDPLDSTYFNTGDKGSDGKPLVQEGGGELRTTAYIDALNFELSILSHKVGLGYGYFNMTPNGDVTATQVVSENSELFRTLKKHEILIRDEMVQFVNAICLYSNEYCNFKIGAYNPDDIDIIFDDSIIEDKQGEKTADQQELATGLMTNVAYAMKWKALDEKDAIIKYQYLDIAKRANTLMPLLDAKLITPELAIEFIYATKAPNIDIKKLLDNLKTDELNIEDGEFEEEEPEEEDEEDE